METGSQGDKKGLVAQVFRNTCRTNGPAPLWFTLQQPHTTTSTL